MGIILLRWGRCEETNPLNCTSSASKEDGMSKKKLAGIIIVCIIAIIVAVVMATHLRLPSSEPLEESLRERATEWYNLLSSLQTVNLTEEQAIGEIEGFLEPSDARTARAEEFYTSWTEGWKVVACSVDDVSITFTKVHGTVRLSIVFEWTGPETQGVQTGDTVAQIQTSSWKLIDEVWYRTMEVGEVE